MHVVFEFPIIDSRRLISDHDGKLLNPDWPQPPDSDKAFIRHFGSVKERKAGGSTYFPGEGAYCNIHLAMKYDDLHTKGPQLSPHTSASIYNSYRRFFSDGYFVSKIEAGFVDDAEKRLLSPAYITEKINLVDVMKHYASLTARIDGNDVKLYKAGPKLVRKYLEESTYRKRLPLKAYEYVQAGEIVILLVYASNKLIELPDRASLIDTIPLPEDYGSLKLYGFKLKHEGYSIKAWLIETPANIALMPANVRMVLRNLRINLLRIHVEKEALRILLNNIQNKVIQVEPSTAEARLLESYVKKTTEKLFSKERFQIPQKNMLDFALHSEHTVSPDSFTNLEQDVFYFKDQFIRNNVEGVLSKMALKKILFVCASPVEKNPLDYFHEFKQIQEALEQGTDRNNYDIDIAPSVKKTEFLNILIKKKPDFLHISMHASVADGLYFEDQNRSVSPLSVDAFAEIIKIYSQTHKLQVVVLSACNSLAHALAIKNYCQHVVGTKIVFPDLAGVVYADSFYRTLVENNSSNISLCHDVAVNQIKNHNPKFDPINGIPVDQIPVLI